MIQAATRLIFAREGAAEASKKGRARGRRVASCDGSLDPGSDTGRPDDVRAPAIGIAQTQAGARDGFPAGSLDGHRAVLISSANTLGSRHDANGSRSAA